MNDNYIITEFNEDHVVLLTSDLELKTIDRREDGTYELWEYPCTLDEALEMGEVIDEDNSLFESVVGTANARVTHGIDPNEVRDGILWAWENSQAGRVVLFGRCVVCKDDFNIEDLSLSRNVSTLNHLYRDDRAYAEHIDTEDAWEFVSETNNLCRVLSGFIELKNASNK